MIVGRIDLTGYRVGWRILIRMREDPCYRSLICLQSLGVVEGCSTMMAWGRFIMYLDGKHATLTQVPIDDSGTCCQIVCCAT
jgi:hypothetical protein